MARKPVPQGAEEGEGVHHAAVRNPLSSLPTMKPTVEPVMRPAQRPLASEFRRGRRSGTHGNTRLTPWNKRHARVMTGRGKAT